MQVQLLSKDLKKRDQFGNLGIRGSTILLRMLCNWVLKISIQFTYIRIELKIDFCGHGDEPSNSMKAVILLTI